MTKIHQPIWKGFGVGFKKKLQVQSISRLDCQNLVSKLPTLSDTIWYMGNIGCSRTENSRICLFCPSDQTDLVVPELISFPEINLTSGNLPGYPGAAWSMYFREEKGKDCYWHSSKYIGEAHLLSFMLELHFIHPHYFLDSLKHVVFAQL